jgi:hypothetical protein
MSLVVLAASAFIPCENVDPLVAKNYRPHPIFSAKDAIVAAQAQTEEFTHQHYSREEWQRAFQAKRKGSDWVLDGQLGGSHQQIQLTGKDGRIACSWAID